MFNFRKILESINITSVFGVCTVHILVHIKLQEYIKLATSCNIVISNTMFKVVGFLERLADRVGKVSDIEVSGRVSGMPEMPDTKPRFWAPETARNCQKLPETIDLEI